MIKKAYRWTKDKVKKLWKWGVAIVIGGFVLAAVIPPSDVSFENLPNVAKEQGIYRITFDEYSDVEIRDQNMPEVKLRKWGDETWIKISYPDFSPVNPKQDKGKLKWVNGNKEVHLYPLEPTEQMEGGGFEFEIVLKNKPLTNKIILDLELNNVKAYYQPPLTEEYQNGWSDEFQTEIVVTEIDVKDLDGNTLVHRPENIVGSYVFYHATKGSIHRAGEAEKYKTSQIGFLYRPKIFDAVGNWAWSKQEIKNGQQIITISQDFLDNAVYPIRHAGGDTLGYTTIGGSSVFERDPKGFKDTAIEDGTVTKITGHYGSSSANNITSRAYVYNANDSLDILSDELSGEVIPVGWTDHNASGSLVDTTVYYVGVSSGFGSSSTQQRISYNTGSSGDSREENGAGYTFPDPWSPSETDKLWSVYATYTPAAPEVRRIIIIE